MSLSKTNPKIIQIIAAPENTEYFSLFSTDGENGRKEYIAVPINYFALLEDGDFSPFTALDGYFDPDVISSDYVGCFNRAELMDKYGDKVDYRGY